MKHFGTYQEAVDFVSAQSSGEYRIMQVAMRNKVRWDVIRTDRFN